MSMIICMSFPPSLILAFASVLSVSNYGDATAGADLRFTELKSSQRQLSIGVLGHASPGLKCFEMIVLGNTISSVLRGKPKCFHGCCEFKSAFTFFIVRKLAGRYGIETDKLRH